MDPLTVSRHLQLALLTLLVLSCHPGLRLAASAWMAFRLSRLPLCGCQGACTPQGVLSGRRLALHPKMLLGGALKTIQ